MNATATIQPEAIAPASEGPPRLLVFSDDWGRHPSSCQHLVSRLLDRYAVTWVNTIGMRTPSFNLATIKRGVEKMTQWARRPRIDDELPENLSVLNPRMWPWFTRNRDRRLNRYLLKRALRDVVDSGDGPITAITTLPIVADLIGELDVDRWIYYCVDDFSVWPGLDQKTLKLMESELIQGVDSIIAVSETLQHRIQTEGRDSDLLTHGVDLDFWSKTRKPLPTELDSLAHPLVTFWGVVDRRMETAFVQRLSADMDAGTILLVGPQQDADPELLATPRVQTHSPLPISQLPALADASDVLIMPYIDADVTRAMQPLKLKEYLATGKPAVVRDLPATRSWENSLDLAGDAEEFSRLVRMRIESGMPQNQQRDRLRLNDESWVAKATRLEQFAQLSQATGVA